MPIVQIQVLQGRTDEQINHLIKNVTEATVTSLEVKPEQVRVIVTEVPPSRWAVGGKSKDMS
ncbi:2-hydroxymuconate tautomerase [Brevibacillus daliensis]|uniref:2-hydroxymuconate tautomerase n=1 Tax=Brevibacillus daliensis TaxID=2892995 RepID=UPI001E421B9B|nr:2-hydroxymuconate tautomerase [Brevibacillus daliensis]